MKAFNEFCRLMERSSVANDGDGCLDDDLHADIRNQLFHRPLVYFAPEKEERALEYAKEHAPNLLEEPVGEAIYVTDSDLVMFYGHRENRGAFHVEHTEQGIRYRCIGMVYIPTHAVSGRAMKSLNESDDPESAQRLESLLQSKETLSSSSMWLFGSITCSPRRGRSWAIDVTCDGFLITWDNRDPIKVDSVSHLPVPGLLDHVRQDFATGLTTTIEYLNYMARPINYIIAEQPVEKLRQRAEKGIQQGRIPRTDSRERIIVMDPDETKVIYQRRELPEGKGTHASPIPHKRRAHKRTYRAERYKQARGKTVEVGESWVGPREGERFEYGRRIYIVRSRGSKSDQGDT